MTKRSLLLSAMDVDWIVWRYVPRTRGVRWLWACQQRLRRSVRRTVTASALPWTARSSNAHLSCWRLLPRPWKPVTVTALMALFTWKLRSELWPVIFGKISGKVCRVASENTIIEVLKAKCLPSLYYGLEACPIHKSQITSLLSTVWWINFRSVWITLQRCLIGLCQFSA